MATTDTLDLGDNAGIYVVHTRPVQAAATATSFRPIFASREEWT